MSLTDFVASNISVSGASSPTVQALNVGCAVVYHNKYPDRLRVYSTSTVLTQLVTDGFKTADPVWKIASAYAAAPNPPSQFCVGRRALAPLQTLQLTCIDGAVGDAYSFTVVNPLGISAQVSYTNAANPGPGIAGVTLAGTATLVPGSAAVLFSAAQTLTAGAVLTFSTQPGVAYSVATATTASTAATLTAAYTGAASSTATTASAGTSAVTNGSTAVTFSVAQTLAAGALLSFASQPGTYYALSAAIAASTAGVLTVAYQGTTATATPTKALGVLAGTFDAVQGSATVVSSASQVVAVNPGDSVQFTSQLGTSYVVASVTASAVTLTTPYTGATAATAYASAVCQISTAAANVAYQVALLASVGTVSVLNSVGGFPVIVQIARTDGALNDIQSWRSGGFSGATGLGTIELADVTADPGIATDLAAIVAANSAAFYGVILDSNSSAEVDAAAKYCETFAASHSKAGFFNTSDYANGQSSVTSDLFSQLAALTLNRSIVQQNNQQLLCYSGAATCGQLLGMSPGSYTAAYKSLPLVPADSDTTLTESEALVINSMTASNPGPGGKYGNYYKSVAGQNWLWPGCAPSGQFFDITIGVDWLALQIQAAVASTLASQPKVPFDDFGLHAIGNAILGVLNLAASPRYKLLLPNGQDPARPLQVNIPTAASLTPAQRASRNVSGFTWSAGLEGAVQTAFITGKLIP